MKCRRMVKNESTGNYDIVWFGSYGKEVKLYNAFTAGDDKISGIEYTYKTPSNSILVMTPSIYVYESGDKTYNASKKVDATNINYASEQEAVAFSLVQRLSVIKNELWYDYKYGMPLTDKVKAKGIIDAYIVKICLAHPDVIDIKELESNIVDGHKYNAYIRVITIYGDIGLQY